jgi:hypothetical protein
MVAGRLTCLVLILLSAAVAATCGKDPVEPSQPSPSCASIAESSRSIVLGPDASTFTLTVNAPAGCSWTPTVSGTFLTIPSGTSAQPRGTLEVSASENTGAERTGTIVVGNAAAFVRQAAAITCVFNVTPTTPQQIPAAGGVAAIDVSVTQGKNCSWTATSPDSFLTIAGGASGVGNGSVRVTVTPNDYVARVGHLTVAGQTVTLNQGGPCRFEFQFNRDTFDVSAGAASVRTGMWDFSTRPCTPTAVSNSSFIGVGVHEYDWGYEITFIVEANPGAARTGTVTVGGLIATINQQGR